MNLAPQAGAFGPYALCGWQVHACVVLPELQAWSGPSGAPDVCVTMIDPARYTDSPKGLQLAEDGSCVLRVGTQALFHINAQGTQVGVWRAADVDPLFLRAHLYGSVLAILCFLRGLLPMHGSCVRLGKTAVLLCGNSGAGKSTLAAALARAGHPFLCDDVCPVDFADPARPVVRPAFPRVKLLEDAMDLFGLPRETLQSEALMGPKFHYGVIAAGPAALTSVPVGAVYELTTEPAAAPTRTPLTGAESFLLLRRHLHRAGMGAILGRMPQAFAQLSLLAQHVPTLHLGRPRDLARLHDVVDLLQHSHAAAPAIASEWRGFSA